MLHQGFNAYADQLSQSAQKEWEKVAGRFEELLFNYPLEESSSLVANALNLRTNNIPNDLIALAESNMKDTLNLGWYGASCNQKILIENSAKLYPLHPTVLPVLVKLFSRFGQNERSLFSFLLSNEPFALQDFAVQTVGKDHFYRIHDLYDYTRANFGHRLSVQSYRSHWNHINSVIESIPDSNEREIQILKTVGLLNLLDISNITASDESISLAVANNSAAENAHVKSSLQSLQKDKQILYYRGKSGGYCLWPYTSVNLERVYEEASKALGTNHRISSLIQDFLETQPLVARRHYIKTGNLRHFEVRYLPVDTLNKALTISGDHADGHIIVALCETMEERQQALEFAKTDALMERPEVLFAVPKPLGNLAGLVHEVQRWDWVSKNTPELNNDPYAAEEVTRQITASRKILEKRIQSFIGLKQFTGQTELQIFHLNESLQIKNGRELLGCLSDVCDDVYSDAPTIHNELVNRRSISTAASSARNRLIVKIFKHDLEPLLGMDDSKKPPEMSIYLSLLQGGGLHRETEEGFAITEPTDEYDNCNIQPAIQHIRQLLESRPDSLVKVSDIISSLRQKPYGVRDGVIPILLAVFAKIHEQNLAFYENGTFLRHITGEDFPRLTKAPDTFEIQYCKTTGIRTEVFDKLLNVLGLKPSGKESVDLLDIVRPLCVFAAQLPEFTHKTKKLTKQALAVRAALVKAREPATLLFHELPKACGVNEISVDAEIAPKDIDVFVEKLKTNISDLKAAFPELKERIKKELAASFDISGPSQDVRQTLSDTSSEILISVSEPRLKGFCLRLNDDNLQEGEWLESLGSYICSKPPSKWLDNDEELFNQELQQIASRFRRVESVLFKNGKSGSNGTAVRLAITKADGSELDKVVHIVKDEESEVDRIEADIIKMLGKNKRVGMAAASRALWKLMNKDDKAN